MIPSNKPWGGPSAKKMNECAWDAAHPSGGGGIQGEGRKSKWTDGEEDQVGEGERGPGDWGKSTMPLKEGRATAPARPARSGCASVSEGPPGPPHGVCLRPPGLGVPAETPCSCVFLSLSHVERQRSCLCDYKEIAPQFLGFKG